MMGQVAFTGNEMDELKSDNLLTLRALKPAKEEDSKGGKGLCGRNYFIPAYQRGYRWNHVQVEQLLRDLTEYFNSDSSNGDFYCLQPMVVKEITDVNLKQDYGLPDPDEPWYEVIDGQQRLTTMLIILTLERLLDEDVTDSFRIYYQTRPGLETLFSRRVYHKSKYGTPSFHIKP